MGRTFGDIAREPAHCHVALVEPSGQQGHDYRVPLAKARKRPQRLRSHTNTEFESLSASRLMKLVGVFRKPTKDAACVRVSGPHWLEPSQNPRKHRATEHRAGQILLPPLVVRISMQPFLHVGLEQDTHCFASSRFIQAVNG